MCRLHSILFNPTWVIQLNENQQLKTKASTGEKMEEETEGIS